MTAAFPSDSFRVADQTGALCELIRFHEAAARLTYAMARLRTERLDEGLLWCLAIFGEYLGAHRAYIFDNDMTLQYWRNTHEWCAPGVSAQKQDLQCVPFSLFPGLIDLFRRGEALALSRIEDMPESMQPGRDILAVQGIRALLMHPMRVDGELIGFVGFDDVVQARSFSATDRAFLGLAADSFAAALVRDRQYRRERETRLQLESANERLCEAMVRLEALSRTDTLTGLANRRCMDQRLAAELSRCGRTAAAASVVLIDVDHFKAVNDRYGHAVGDAVLTAVAQLLREGLRACDHVARWGGEEFLILLPETALGEAVQLAERLRRKIEQFTHLIAGLGEPLTISLGVASHRGGEGMDRLLVRADEQLYRAKSAGRNKVACEVAG